MPCSVKLTVGYRSVFQIVPVVCIYIYTHMHSIQNPLPISCHSTCLVDINCFYSFVSSHSCSNLIAS
jgi:hypothetical protein